jgi:TetR/AcrR family transcriptional regulator
MLLFGMINWLFTWFQDDGALDYAQMARLVSDFVRGGLAQLGSESLGSE